jgi:DNA-binding MurR/RpiR family transcriptional regulator
VKRQALMNVKETIEAFDDKLTESDRQLIQILMSSPSGGAFSSAAEIAQKAGVHSATAVRLAKKLGFTGYPEFRSKLQEDFLEDTCVTRVQDRLAKAGDGSILQTLIDSEIAALQAIPDHVEQSEIDRAAELLIDARQISVFGIGHAASLATLFAGRLSRSGYAAEPFSVTGHQAAEKIVKLRDGGVLVAIAFRTMPDGLDDMLALTRKLGGRVIVISDLMGTFIRPRPDALLAASRGTRGESQSLTVPLALCGTLILEISRKDQGHSLRSLESLNEARAAIRGRKRRTRKTPANDRGST